MSKPAPEDGTRDTQTRNVSQRQFLKHGAERCTKGTEGTAAAGHCTEHTTVGTGHSTGVTSENTTVLAGVGAGQGAEGDDFEELLSSKEKNASENSETADDSNMKLWLGAAKTNISFWIYHFSREEYAKRRAHEL